MSINGSGTNSRINSGIFCDDDYAVQFQTPKRGQTRGLITCKRNEGSFLNFRIMSLKKNVPHTAPNYKVVMEIVHVFVPELSRGLKIAESLTIKAFSIAELNEWDVIPTCSYVRDTFIKRRPEYQARVVQELSPKINPETESCSKQSRRTKTDISPVDFAVKRKRASTGSS